MDTPEWELTEENTWNSDITEGVQTDYIQGF